MSVNGWMGIAVLLVLMMGIGLGVGTYLERVLPVQGEVRPRSLFGRLETAIYRAAAINPRVEMDWKTYMKSVLAANLMMALVGYLLLRLQGRLPLNPAKVSAPSWDLAWNTVVSFVTNTNWQNYAGESALSYWSQMTVITYLQFASAATGIAVALAVVRGLVRQKARTLGNFWVDWVSVQTRVLLPFALILGFVFIALGVPQTLGGPVHVVGLSGVGQTIARGPVASLEAIKQLGTNGGGFFNANSAHPFEDPTPLTAVLEILAMTAIPLGLVFYFGRQIKNHRQAWVIVTYLMALLILGIFLIYQSQSHGNPWLSQQLGIHGPNYEGQEWRFGPALSSVFTAVTTAFGTGAVNGMHDSLMPLAGMVALVFMMLNVVFGGSGVGLINILMFLLITVFLSGLMVGRTPEMFGKKIEAREIKLATVAMLVHPFLILVPTAVALLTPAGLKSLGNPGLHGFTEILYAFTSTAANNGSAFAGLNGNTLFYNLLLGWVMLLGRYVSLIAMLAIAGSLAEKATIPETLGTLKTDSYAFGGVFVGVVLIVGALTFFPALAVGPIGEHLQLWAQSGH
ncbi:potassium-transporting ATPase, A subunit [Sulfobacillus acidophilus TPY]|uniref:Potassium-transporting ATPase potassium-binding subunit n=1 Tax=Sulfobacillus acidophilus (strain ATCC 700253 / DSM 10332 / NAL) TaxID=679936 RepID=G8TYY4_SULAD|nr:potassium-transporting ATPase, A subunit [Sulfobacillus acidophilus TPY]AEW05163.1 Potassium-transporting ATPase A chain [Sulfobacillus acidophilus DSM 10332]